jgi:hypothetical protein
MEKFMSPNTIKTIIAIVLLLHGFAHGRAFFYLVADAFGMSHAPTLPVRTWLIPSLSLRAASSAASVFYFLSTIGFFVTAWLVWSTDASGGTWRQIAVISAIISTLGSVLFSGIWPGAPTQKMSTLDTAISLVINVVILVALLGLKWPPQDLFINA